MDTKTIRTEWECLKLARMWIEQRNAKNLSKDESFYSFKNRMGLVIIYGNGFAIMAWQCS